jgi:DNA modification methylase
MAELTVDMVPVEDLHLDPSNARTGHDIDQIAASIQEFGFADPIEAQRGTGRIIAGNGRYQAARQLKMEAVPVVWHDMDDLQATRYGLANNRLTDKSEWDMDILPTLLAEVGTDIPGFDDDFMASLDMGDTLAPAEDPGADIDRADELRDKWQVETGQIWTIGEHRLMCGDSTDGGSVLLLMDGETADLLHADPPYGMGKEKEGIQNDNLYREKLDDFQMAWWAAFRPSINDNGSAYIWGNAEDLWRLWYCGGLRDSERLTFRDEIAWDKGGGGMAVGTEAGRMYQRSERCLFFMLGEQGFNENADNYWEGWEPIRLYLEGERKKMGWDVPTMKRIAGHSDLSRDHWTSKSQWTFPTEKVYRAFQAEANHDAFKRDYDELKRDYDELKRDYDELKKDFYATRAYFDNAHDNMTDIWDFPRVSGEDRHGHATPKPVHMIARAIKSSSPDGAVIAEPFLGSGTTMVAAEQLGRKCYGMEIDPKYCAVVLERMSAMVDNITLSQ